MVDITGKGLVPPSPFFETASNHSYKYYIHYLVGSFVKMLVLLFLATCFCLIVNESKQQGKLFTYHI